jgi:hypothetical protein
MRSDLGLSLAFKTLARRNNVLFVCDRLTPEENPVATVRDPFCTSRPHPYRLEMPREFHIKASFQE